jgi:exosortase
MTFESRVRTLASGKLRILWPLLLGFAVLMVPTSFTLADQIWSREAGAHGPIIILTGLWLLWRQLPDLNRDARPGNNILTALLLLATLGLYVFGRSYDFVYLEAGGLYAAALTLIYAEIGFAPMRRNWFPFVYLCFAIPPPHWLLDAVTAPLKRFVSTAATSSLQLFDIPVSHEGVTIFVSQYQLLVEDACSGMNSLIGLIAISLLYIYLAHGSSWRHSLTLMLFIVPIAILANILRIMFLILLTYFFGDAVGQGFLHVSAGMALFAVSLLIIFALDQLLTRTYQNLRGAHGRAA